MSDKAEMPKILCDVDILKKIGGKKQAMELLRGALHFGSSPTVNKAIKNIKILKARTVPTTYGMFTIEYEQITVGEKEVKPEKGRASAKIRPKVEDYMECAKYSRFDTIPQRLYFPETYYSFPCAACGAKGGYRCNCDGGYMTCPSCGGRKESSCFNCSGHGYIYCYYCYGRDTCCTYCGGSGQLTCTSCGGYGYFDCTSCHGNGYTICDICGGSRVATCRECGGAGQCATAIYVERGLGTFTYKTPIIFLTYESDRYPDGFSSSAKPVDTDTFLGKIDSSNEPLTELESKILGKYKLDLRDAMRRSIKELEKSESKKKLSYSCEVYRRDYVEIEFEFEHKKIAVMWEPTNNKYYFTCSPIKIIVDKIRTELATAVEKKQKHKVKKLLDEYTAISKEYEF